MKKSTPLAFLATLLLLLFLFSACNTYDGWKVVEIEDYGTIKVPQEWEASTVDGYLYFSVEENGEKKPVLIQYHRGLDCNESLPAIEEFIWLRDENYSNSAGYGKYDLRTRDEIISERFVLYVTQATTLYSSDFICVDDRISEDTLKKIAKSYKCVHEDT